MRNQRPVTQRDIWAYLTAENNGSPHFTLGEIVDKLIETFDLYKDPETICRVKKGKRRGFKELTASEAEAFYECFFLNGRKSFEGSKFEEFKSFINGNSNNDYGYNKNEANMTLTFEPKHEVKEGSSDGPKMFVIDVLETALPNYLVDNVRQKFPSNRTDPIENFIGREKELKEISEKLKDKHYLFLTGVSGIGKRELALKYAYNLWNNNSSVVTLDYYDSLERLFANDKDIDIEGVRRERTNDGEYSETIEEYAIRKINEFNNRIDEDDLLVINNFDNHYDSLLNKILKLNCKIILTTNKTVTSPYNQLEVGHLSKKESFSLFKANYEDNLSRDKEEKIRKFIEDIDYHTLAIAIAAKQIKNSYISIDQLVPNLPETIFHSIDGMNKKAPWFEFIKQCFDTSKMKAGQIEILKNLALIPYSGIKIEDFKVMSNLDSYNDINELISLYWVNKSKKIDFKSQSYHSLHIHPIVKEIIDETYFKEPNENCSEFLLNILNAIDRKVLSNYLVSINVNSGLHQFCKNIINYKIQLYTVVNLLVYAFNAFIPYGMKEEGNLCIEHAIKIALSLSLKEKNLDKKQKMAKSAIDFLVMECRNLDPIVEKEKCIKCMNQAKQIATDNSLCTDEIETNIRMIEEGYTIESIACIVNKFYDFLKEYQCDTLQKNDYPEPVFIKNEFTIAKAKMMTYKELKKAIELLLEVKEKAYNNPPQYIEVCCLLVNAYKSSSELSKAKKFANDAYQRALTVFGKEDKRTQQLKFTFEGIEKEHPELK